MPKFTDSHNHTFQLDPNHRDRVVPRWPNIFKPQKLEVKETRVAFARTQVVRMRKRLTERGASLNEARILEVGCYSGVNAMALAEVGVGRVDAFDNAKICLRFKAGPIDLDRFPTLKNLEAENHWLWSLRHEGAEHFTLPPNVVHFRDWDVHTIELNKAYDVVASWQTLEHLYCPLTALRKMYDALKPGGWCYHVYNPFFGLDGGHSLCTLDIPWGHVILSSADYGRYLREFRQKETKLTLDFYLYGLNRMTITDLRTHAKDVGFCDVSVRTLIYKGTPSAETIDLARTQYLTLKQADLISNTVLFMARKPK